MGSYLAELHAICCRSIPQFPSPASHACCISASVIQLSPANRLHYLFLKTASSKMRFLHTALSALWSLSVGSLGAGVSCRAVQ